MLLIFLACAPDDANERRPGPSVPDSTVPTVPDVVDTGDGAAADTAADTAVVEDIAGDGQPEEEDLSDQLFGLDVVHTAELTLTQSAIDSLAIEPYTYVEAELTFDGERLDPVAMRIKGRLGSFRTIDGKPALKIDLNHFSDQELFGLERLNFNNMVQDDSMTHEVIAYALFNAVGVSAPRVGYVWVTINGEAYGLYSHVEVYDDTWLKRTYDDPSGNLYDGDYFLHDSGSYTLIDFNGSSEQYFNLDEGKDVGFADILGVTVALAGAGSEPYEALDAVLDMDHFLRMWATEAWLGHYDGYAYNSNNYRVYFDPTDGRARMHPWDPDWAFYSATPLTSPAGDLASTCLLAASCRAEFVATLQDVKAAASTSGLQATLQEATELIGPYVDADPRKERTTSAIYTGQSNQMAWLINRDQALAVYGW